MLSENLIKIAVIGDVHNQWEPEDEIALQQLGVDLVLFVGDFGNEAVEVVKAIASVKIPLGVILGNHDAWYSATEWGKKQCPYDRRFEDRVQQQLEILKTIDLGYSFLDFPHLHLSIVGSRPFSWGGSVWKNEQFYEQRFGIKNFAESTEKIKAAALATAYDNLIFVGHNGPFGLGDQPEDPCGKDWEVRGGDFGDPDLAAAIAFTRTQRKNIPLVAFGHMHHRLRHTTTRLRKAIFKSNEGTIYLNAASVPRIIQVNRERLRNFSLVFLKDSNVTKVSLVWIGKDYRIASEQILYQQEQITLCTH